VAQEVPGIRGPGSDVSTPTFFYIGTLAILIVMFVSCRCHAEWCLSNDVLDELGHDRLHADAISNRTG
jgi:hypothetical protein